MLDWSEKTTHKDERKCDYEKEVCRRETAERRDP